ncbi:monooxygenase [Paenibacillus maysiensis]|uniref:monooxygenase n=1 Tax=Paenibacillus maysiensis TaxID=1155954 RepID=UPI00046F0E35|nr:monooxygenase [Paenibacillus maysiensis]
MDYEVIIVGGGPVGMWLAAELALAKVSVCVIERLEETSPYSRALTLHPRTLEMFDMRGLKERFMEHGKPISTGHFAMLDTRLDFSVLDSSSNYTLFIPQEITEQVLEEHATKLGVVIRRGEEVVSVREQDQGVEVVSVRASGPHANVSVMTAAYVVGADGAGSTVRKQAGIAFPGTDTTLTAVLADVELAVPPENGIRSEYTERGGVMIAPVSPDIYRVILTTPHLMHVPKDVPVTLEEIQTELRYLLGTDLGASNPRWLSRFGNATRQAETYRKGRILLAGDAAHIHFPAGGQGMNVGLQEATNLGWKLAGVINGWAADTLLDSYHGERYPINTQFLRNTEIQTSLLDFTTAVLAHRQLLEKWFRHTEINRSMAEQISALDVGYPAAEGMPQHPLNGKRFADFQLRLSDGTKPYAYDLFHEGRFVLLHLAQDAKIANELHKIALSHISYVEAVAEEAPVGWSDVHTVLIRPDGYIAWAISLEQTDVLRTIGEGIASWCSGEPVLL